MVKDYLHDPDDFAHLDADVERCGDCAGFVEPRDREDLGWCLELEVRVKPRSGIDGGCPFYERRP